MAGHRRLITNEAQLALSGPTPSHTLLPHIQWQEVFYFQYHLIYGYSIKGVRVQQHRHGFRFRGH